MSRGKTMFVYKKLWALMESKGVTRNDLRNNGILSPSTIAKLGKNERVSIDVIESLCEYLDCQPGDIMEYVSDKKLAEATAMLAQLQHSIIEVQKKFGITDKDIDESGILDAIRKGELESYMDNLIHPKDEPKED